MKKVNKTAILAGVLAAALATTGCASKKENNKEVALAPTNPAIVEVVNTPAPTPVPTPIPELNTREDALNDDIVEEAVNKFLLSVENATLTNKESLKDLKAIRNELEDLVRMVSGQPTKNKYTEEELLDIIYKVTLIGEFEHLLIAKDFIEEAELEDNIIFSDLGFLFPNDCQSREIHNTIQSFKEELYLNRNNKEETEKILKSALEYYYSKIGAFGDLGTEVEDIEIPIEKVLVMGDLYFLYLSGMYPYDNIGLNLTLEYPEESNSHKKTFKSGSTEMSKLVNQLITSHYWKPVEEYIISQDENLSLVKQPQ